MVKVQWENGFVGECNEAVAKILIKKGRVKKVGRSTEPVENKKGAGGRPRNSSPAEEKEKDRAG